ncbi:MAG: protein phosphatase 2C domain-containing protein [Oscillatoriales cyanobacterium RM2_1_1]|nr:protein phosphatase 2C domain-containing protein [Oscillatoriales cyanobacterium SM2_3_0]NJO45611.1 protein phosphatase 2C domain-containing protein [Oscillatoriales cyanobacterium RM2_1_1]
MTPVNWQVVAASVIGKSHEKHNLPCQDAHSYQVFTHPCHGQCLVVAVADGAGSARLSDLGAQLAVKVAVETMVQSWPEISLAASDEIWQTGLIEAIKAAQQAIATAAAAQQVEPRALATTLILAVATSMGIRAAQVGDGAVIIANQQGEITALTTPDWGEHLNETTFLTCPDALETLQIRSWLQPPANLAIFSDGLQLLALKLPESIPHPPFFAPLFEFVRQVQVEEATEQLVSFLKSPRVTERTDDDLTLILATLKL